MLVNARQRTGMMDSISIYSAFNYGPDDNGSPTRLHRDCLGSIPTVSTLQLLKVVNASITQRFRVLPLQGRGQWFEST